MAHEAEFIEEQGILVPSNRPSHRNDENDEMGFDVLIRMQR